MYILDTNVISELRRPDICNPRVRLWVASHPIGLQHISAVTVLEIERGIFKAEQQGDKVKAALFSRWLNDLVLPAFAGRILPMNETVARRAARLPWPKPDDFRDPVIAATALSLDATVVTRNVKDFAASGAKIVNPWD